MALKLYGTKVNANTFKALVTAQYAGVPVELAPFEMGVTNKTPAFLKLNPIGKVPVLETPTGPIFESNSIARYIARLSDSGLYGSSVYESASIDQWLDFGTNEVYTPTFQWASPLYGMGPRIVEVETKAKEKAERALAALNKFLETRTYLVGDSVTLADIVIACSLYYGFTALFSAAYIKGYPHVGRYFSTLVNQPKFKAVLGEVKQCQETPLDVLPPEKNPFLHVIQRHARAAAGAGAAAAAGAGAAAAGAGVAAASQKEAAPATPPLAEGEEAPKPKAKNPLDLLPPSPMVLDAWKRLYSNTKAAQFREVAIKGFWDMYDPEGYSLWFCDYKHNDENMVRFITLNKVSGFLQRMDLVRKYAFAKMCILGPEEGPFSIRGVWLFRGQEVPPFVMSEVYDMELYDWTKADVSDEKQKALVSDMFEETDDIDGVHLVEAKCFK